jgi:uncharacterized protein (DUF3084 family)
MGADPEEREQMEIEAEAVRIIEDNFVKEMRAKEKVNEELKKVNEELAKALEETRKADEEQAKTIEELLKQIAELKRKQ